MFPLCPIKAPEYCSPKFCGCKDSVTVRSELYTSDATTVRHPHPDGVPLAVPDNLHLRLVRPYGYVPANTRRQ